VGQTRRLKISQILLSCKGPQFEVKIATDIHNSVTTISRGLMNQSIIPQTVQHKRQTCQHTGAYIGCHSSSPSIRHHVQAPSWISFPSMRLNRATHPLNNLLVTCQPVTYRPVTLTAYITNSSARCASISVTMCGERDTLPLEDPELTHKYNPSRPPSFCELQGLHVDLVGHDHYPEKEQGSN